MGDSKAMLRKDYTGEDIQAPEIASDNIKRGSGAIDVSKALMITFDSDAIGAQLNIGSTANASNFFVLNGGESFTIDKDVTSLYVSQDCGYILN